MKNFIRGLCNVILVFSLIFFTIYISFFTDIPAGASNEISDSDFYINGWLQIHLPEAKIANMVTMVCRDGYFIDSQKAPRDWVLKGSNDGETWTTLLTVTDQIPTSIAQKFSYTFDNSTAYLYYRADVTRISIADQKISIAQLNLIHRITHESN